MRCLLGGRDRSGARRSFGAGSAIEPGRVPKIQEHLRAGCQSVGRELKSCGGTLAVEITGLLDRINIFNLPIRFPEVIDVIRKRIGDALGSMHELRKIFSSYILCHISALKLSVNSVLRGVALGVWSDPSVVVNRGVQRLGTICYVVPEPPGVKDYRVFHGSRWLMDFTKMPVFPESRL